MAIDITKIRSRKSLETLVKEHEVNTSWPMEVKIGVVTRYLAIGNMSLVAASTGLDHQMLRNWKTQPWWKEVEAQVRATENLQLDTKISKIVDKSLDAVLDRVENGDFIYDNKTGDIKRKPANMRDIAKVSTEMISKRELLRGNATSRNETPQASVAEQLKSLAIEFARWNKKQPTQQETLDVESIEILEDITLQEGNDDAIYDEREEGLQEGSGPVHQ